MKNHPVNGRIYTLRSIMNLDLRDGPSLGFQHFMSNPTEPGYVEGHTVECCIQDAHVTVEQMLDIPGMASTQWEYVCETREWVPVFNYAGPMEDLLACFDMEPEIPDDIYSPHERHGWWVTPKGYPRAQQWFKDGKLMDQDMHGVLNEDEEGSTPD